MAETTEVYICGEGQALKEGKLEYSDSIYEKADAKGDAEYRCIRDSSIFKIAYYRVNTEGEFNLFYSYSNPHARSVPKKPGDIDPSKRKRRRLKKKVKKSWWQKLFGK